MLSPKAVPLTSASLVVERADLLTDPEEMAEVFPQAQGEHLLETTGLTVRDALFATIRSSLPFCWRAADDRGLLALWGALPIPAAACRTASPWLYLSERAAAEYRRELVRESRRFFGELFTVFDALAFHVDLRSPAHLRYALWAGASPERLDEYDGQPLRLEMVLYKPS